MNRIMFAGITAVSAVLPAHPVFASETLTIAMHPDRKPFVFYDEDGKLSGIDVDLAQLIAQEEDVELVIDEMELDEIMDAVASGDADMGISAITVTDERAELVDFSDDYLLTKKKILVSQKSDIAKKEDLSGKTVGIMQGDASEAELMADETITVQSLKDYSQILSFLLEGLVDAVIIDEKTGKMAVEEENGIQMLEDEYSQERFAIILPKGQTEELSEINQMIAVLKETGELQMMIEKYIMEETETLE